MAETFDSAAMQLGIAAMQIPAIPVREAREQARSAHARVVNGWPVDSGESARGFTTLETPQGARLFNDVPHAFYVGEGQAHQEIQTSIRDGEPLALSRMERDATALLEG